MKKPLKEMLKKIGGEHLLVENNKNVGTISDYLDLKVKPYFNIL